MKKLILTVLLAALGLGNILSQEFKIGFNTGIGSFAMKDLKSINTDIISSLPFDAKVVSDFPVYFFYEPNFHLNIKRIELGLLYTYQSTGSRASAKDYSGEFRFDMKTGSNSFGLSVGYDIWAKDKNKLAVNSTFRIMFSKLKMSEYFAVMDSVLVDNSADFNSKNYSMEPGLTFTRSFSHYFSMALNAGYLFCFGAQPFRSLENSDYILHLPGSDKEVKPDWNGFRLGLTFSVNFTD